MPSIDNSRATPVLTLIATILSVATLYFARSILVPLALAVLIAFILSPVVTWLEKIHIGRVVSVVVVSVLFISCTAGLAWIVTHQLLDVADKFPDYKENIKDKLSVVRSMRDGRISKATGTVNELGSEISEAAAPAQPANTPAHSRTRPMSVVVQPQSDPFSMLTSMLGPLLGPIGTGGVVIVFAIFMLINRESLRNRFLRLAGQGHLSSTTLALDEATKRVSRYLLLQSLVNISYGCLVGLGLHLIGVPNPVLWGVLAGLLRYIPYLGPLVGGILPFFLALGAFDDWKRPLIVLAMFVVLELSTANFVEPMLYGSQTGITSIAILIAAIFWTVVWGPVGLLLSTPLTVCLVAFGKHIPKLEFLTVLFGDETILPPDAKIYQRLLASDPEEARQIAEAHIKESSIEDLYESVLIPVLILARRDRDRSRIDESQLAYLYRNTRELVEELGDELTAATAESTGESEKGRKLERPASDTAEYEAVVIPAQDEGDEIVGIMLAQFASKNGCKMKVFAADRTADFEKSAANRAALVVCVSALPPCSLSRTRSLFARLKETYGSANILVGLWNFTGAAPKAAERIGASNGDKVVTTLSETMNEINALCDHSSEEPAATYSDSPR
jgi:predicted PurR-regulated permease PerM